MAGGYYTLDLPAKSRAAIASTEPRGKYCRCLAHVAASAEKYSRPTNPYAVCSRIRPSDRGSCRQYYAEEPTAVPESELLALKAWEAHGRQSRGG